MKEQLHFREHFESYLLDEYYKKNLSSREVTITNKGAYLKLRKQRDMINNLRISKGKKCQQVPRIITLNLRGFLKNLYIDKK